MCRFIEAIYPPAKRKRLTEEARQQEALARQEERKKLGDRFNAIWNDYLFCLNAVRSAKSRNGYVEIIKEISGLLQSMAALEIDCRCSWCDDLREALANLKLEAAILKLEALVFAQNVSECQDLAEDSGYR